jgi:hypothetical protein
MSRPRWLALVLLAFAIPLTLAACGGDDDDDGGGDGSDDQAQITATIEAAATGTDPEKCTMVMTQRFVEQTNFSTGEEAVTQCEEDAGNDPAAESVDVTNIEVDGESATAEAAATGGGLNGQTIAVSLVKQGDQWKLDHLDDFVEFDAGAFADSVAESASAGGETPQQTVDCIRNRIQSSDPEQVKAAYLSGNAGQLLGLFGACLQQG